jgi:hypothetical protein
MGGWEAGRQGSLRDWEAGRLGVMTRYIQVKHISDHVYRIVCSCPVKHGMTQFLVLCKYLAREKS